MTGLTDQFEEGQADRRHRIRRRSDARAAHILERITDEFSAFDRDWRFTYVNQAALNAARRVLGKALRREDVLGKNIWEMLPPHVGSVVYQKYHEAMREQTMVEFEAQSAATGRWVEVRLYPSDEGLSVYARDITERKRVEAQLAYHASLLDNIHDAVIATDAQLIITAWNKGAEQMYGWAAADARGRHIGDVVPAELSDQQRAEALRNLREERSHFRAETVTYRKDGAPVSVEGITIALRGEQQGSPLTGYVTIRRDITARKRAEEALRASRQRIDNVLASITDAFYTLDREWRYTYMNERAWRRFQVAKGTALTRDEILGTRTLWEIFPELVGSVYFQKYHEALREQTAVHFEARSVVADIWNEMHVYPSDEGLSVYIHDITERKRAEGQLRRSEAYLAEGQRLSHTGSWAWNVPGGDLFWSQEQFRMYGLDPARSVPSLKEAFQLIHPEDRRLVRRSMDAVVYGLIDGAWECRIITGDGIVKHVHTTAHPIVSDGTLIEVVGTTMDISERKQEEAARQELVRRLTNALEAERRRLSRELDDQFGQELSALQWRLEAMRQDHAGQRPLDDRNHRAAGDCEAPRCRGRLYCLAIATDGTRRFLGLAAALEHYLASWSAHCHINGQLHVRGIESNVLPDEIRTAFYRIVQEALTNVAKHSGATDVEISWRATRIASHSSSRITAADSTRRRSSHPGPGNSASSACVNARRCCAARWTLSRAMGARRSWRASRGRGSPTHPRSPHDSSHRPRRRSSDSSGRDSA